MPTAPTVAAFADKVAIVTGGAAGIGSAISRVLADAGANVWIVDVDGDAAADTIASISGGGSGSARWCQADLGESDGCRGAVAGAVAEFGAIDILVNNVGMQPVESYQNAENTSEETWDRILAVNLKSYFLMAKYAIPEIRKRGGGAIVNIASVQGLQSQNLVPAYAASKGGILSLNRQLALDYSGEGIRVNAVNPGITESRLLRRAAELEDGPVEKVYENWGRMQPIGRICTGDDIANAVAFLASDQAAAITGEYLNVDGGLMALGGWAAAAGASAAE
jgi:NAD(P)-dependent dehydrogenase (short-subunit alcohol dehydrogenase family)